MTLPQLDDYAVLENNRTAGLVSRDGCIDLLCLPHLDSAGPFAALLDSEEGGSWRIAPYGHIRACRRRYRGDTLVLETHLETAEGSIRLVDFMPNDDSSAVVRLVVGVRGRVPMLMDFRPRFDHGRIRPSLRRIDGADVAIAEPDSVWLRTPVETRADDAAVHADFVVSAGELLPFVLTWHPSHGPTPVPVDPLRALAETE